MTTLSYRVGDFETASGCDLKRAGAWRYAEDISTEVLCFSFGPDHDHLKTWFPGLDAEHPITLELKTLAADDSVTWIAHNSQFEKAIWRRIMMLTYGFDNIPNSRWHDTMAVAAMKVLPQKLERLIQVLRLPHEKDMEGNKLTLSFSRANKQGYFPTLLPHLLERVGDYCETDCKGEFDVHNRLGWLPPGERRVWLLDQRINERGVRLDMAFVSAANDVVRRASAPLAKEFVSLTGLNMTQVDKVKAWCAANGAAIPNMQKETLAQWLGKDIDGDLDDSYEYDPGADRPTIPAHVHRALSIRQLIGSASVKKLGAMEACVCGDGRARGLLQYHGAGPGRWAGRLLQPQNFPRGTLEVLGTDGKMRAIPPEQLVDAVLMGDLDYIQDTFGPPVEMVVGGLRHAIIADDDRELVVGDFKTIEARIVLALAGQHDKVKLIEAGVDIYNDMASTIYHKPIDRKVQKKEGQVGKNSVLGLGFQMGAPKFQFKYAPDENLAFCERVVTTYRKDWAPCVPRLWYALERAAVRTVWDKTPHEAFGVEYRLEDGWLTARLPSGRKLWYFNPQPIRKAMPWDHTDVRQAWTYQALKMNVWKTIDAYGGSLTENVVQALARDLMVAAMFRCEQNNMPVVLTVHDEIITEPLKAHADYKALTQMMRERDRWAVEIGIPVDADCWQGQRYKK